VTDNISVTAGTGTTIATDDVGGTHYQKVKPVWGASDTVTDITASTPLPVDVIAAVKAASTAPVAADKALVVAVSPNSPGVIDAANSVHYSTNSPIANTTEVTLLLAPGAGLRHYITSITIGNGHATVGTFVVVKDGAGGTAMWTGPAAVNFGGATVSFPVPLRQPTLNTALIVQCVTTGAQVYVSASGYKSV
jgi:hypothetical protein